MQMWQGIIYVSIIKDAMRLNPGLAGRACAARGARGNQVTNPLFVPST